MPLLEVVKRTAPTKAEGKKTSVFDILSNLAYGWCLSSKTAMSEMQTNPGGCPLLGDDAIKHGVACDYMFWEPVE